MSILSSLSTTQWFQLGPAPIKTTGVGLGFSAGRVEVAAAHPSNASVMFVGADNGGVWKTGTWDNTADVAPTWLSLSDGEPSLDFAGYHGLVVHPANHSLVLAAVSGPGAGLLKSTNGGLGWQLLGNALFEGAVLGSLAVHPNNTNIIYLSVWRGGPGGGVYKSADGGLNWQNTTSFHTGFVSDVIIARFNPQLLFAGLTAGSGNVANAGVYRSTDGGANWQAMVGTGLPSSFFLGSAARLESASTTGVVYTALLQTDLNGTTTVGRYRTSNAGQTWTQLSPTPGTPELRAWHLLLAVDARNADHVLANDAYTLFESTDGGKTWTKAESIGDDWVNATFDANNNVVVTADRNLYLYVPETKEWRAREGNLGVTEFYDITLDLQNPDVVYGVSQDHPDAMKFDGSVEWSYMPGGGGETGKVLVDPGNSSLLFLSHPLDPVNLVQRSTDGGQSWTTILETDEFDAEDYDLAYSTQKSFAMDPSSPGRLLLGTTKIFETLDAAAPAPTWTDFASTLSPSSTTSDQYITALSISSDGEAVYACTSDGHVWLKQPNKFWEQTDKGLFGQNAGRVLDVRIDPADRERAFAVSTGQGGVWYLSKKGGLLEWSNVAGNLPKALRAASILVDWRYSIPSLFVGTSRGVYHSVDLGQHWTKFGLYLPNTLVTDLQALEKLDILAAGTFGRGAWEILIPRSRIKGRVFEDLDADGAPDRREKGMSGVTVFLDVNGNGVADEFELSTSTDAAGHYSFDRVPSGTYTLREVVPAGYVATTPVARPIVVAGSELSEQDFGNRRRQGQAEPVEPAEPYTYVSDLNALPGRKTGEAVGARDEFDERRRHGE